MNTNPARKSLSLTAITAIFSMLFISISPASAGLQPAQPIPPLITSNQTNLPGGVEVWEYWQPADVKGLDPWGDSESHAIDPVAIYEKTEADALAFRLDFMDLVTDAITPTYFALDFTNGGSRLIEPGNISVTFEIDWDLMVAISGTQFTLYDANFAEHPGDLSNPLIDRQLDFVSFAIDRGALAGWDGSPFQMQALVADEARVTLLDQTTPVLTNASTGQAKLIVLSVGGMLGFLPTSISWYDGYALRPTERPGERRGFRYTLDAVEKYQLPLTFIPFGLDTFPAVDFLGINERLNGLASRGLLEPIGQSFYGHFMVWQPDDVNQKMLEMVSELNQTFGMPVPQIFAPYEDMVTPANIQTIQDAGFQAMYAGMSYRFWFGGNTTEDVLRKVHIVNGMPVVFFPGVGNYHWFDIDERWPEFHWGQGEWEAWREYDSYLGTDQGLYLWFRRILQDMAMDADQEQFFAIGTDYTLTAWMFPDIADYTFKWLASHPWIEVTTYNSILERGWTPIDHGTLPLEEDELLYQYFEPGEMHYNAYFPWFYYGGTSDGHSPLIPDGEDIEAYYDYVPYLRDSQHIPSGRIMGDDHTPGSIVYETLANLRAAPENDLTTLAWIAYFHSIGEQTMHTINFYSGTDPYYGGDWGGKYLSPDAKFVANKMRQVNKIIAAAVWAEQTANGLVPGEAQAAAVDLDLDGELEYVLSNDRVFAIFENDGARLEYAFAYSPAVGPVQVIGPVYQITIKKGVPDGNYEMGEIGELLNEDWRTDSSFVEDLDLDRILEYPVYTASIQASSLVFSSPASPVVKTFVLEGDTIHGYYTIEDGVNINTSFGFVTNMLQMYRQDWYQPWRILQPGNWAGVQTSAGGSVLVTDVLSRGEVVSFLQSPARQDQQERDDNNTYPGGHYFPFPYSTVGYWNRSVFSLLLRADSLHFVFLPMLQR